MIERFSIDALGAVPQLFRGNMELGREILDRQMLVPMCADKQKDLF